MHKLTLLISTLLCTLSASAAPGNIPEDSLILQFRNPPKVARPYVWWHWMDGEVSKQGIVKDLEWMKRAGIAGFHQFDAGGVNMPRTGVRNLPYFSDGWKEAFRFALHRADSMGFEVTIASAPGWSSTGGPWVKPEEAMKKLEWRTVEVEGGGVRIQLPPLYNKVGPYQDLEKPNDRVTVRPYGCDLAVLAARIPDADRTMESLGARLAVSDTAITCTFPEAQTIQALTLNSGATAFRPREGEIWRNVLESSDDGTTWRLVSRLSPSPFEYTTLNIPATTARCFRIRGEKLVSLRLFTVPKVHHCQELAGFALAYDFNKFHTAPTPYAIALSDIVDLTGSLAPDGTLSCELPAGRWRIYRFGVSLTGKVNHPASPDATGLEVDKLDPEAWDRYFRNYLDIYKEAAGGLLGARGITRLLTDSYEAGAMTWTRDMPALFASERGYDLLPWLPVLTGDIVGSAEESERFLWDWRKTIGDRFARNYDRINDILEEYGMAGRYTESHEVGRAFVGDGMDLKRTAAVPMSAIWMENTPTGSKVPQAISDIRESASVAHIFGQKVVAAESFTVNGDERHAYTYCPENMKFIADLALQQGLNRFVIHESAAQPSDTYLPGLGLFRYGQWFHRNETWAEYASVWTDYLARNCFLLQQGHAVADILLFYGEDSNATAAYGGEKPEDLPQVPEGYEYDYANPYVLLHGVTPADGALVTATGMQYRVLMLGTRCGTMSPEILRRIRSFAEAGVVVCGAEPSRCGGGRMASGTEFRDLVADIWHSGRKNVTQDLPEALQSAGCAPDVSGTEPGLRHVHRRLPDGRDLYWIRNFSGKDVRATLSFRSGHRCAALLNPENGRAVRIACTEENGRSRVTADLRATDTRIFLLSDTEPALATASGLLPESREYSVLEGPWKIHFAQKNGGTRDEVLTALHSWTESADPVVKYCSGTAAYRTTFRWKGGRRGCIRLDLGVVKNIAEVIVNGQPAGVLWKAPFVTEDLRPFLRKGRNTLEIKVTNLWVNRMIGDCEPDGGKPVTSVRRFYKAGDPLLPSGLLGPVRITVE